MLANDRQFIKSACAGDGGQQFSGGDGVLAADALPGMKLVWA
jgi:hypothetical protein